MYEFESWQQFYTRLIELHRSLGDLCLAIDTCAARAPLDYPYRGQLGASVIDLRHLQGRILTIAEWSKANIETNTS